MKAEKLEHLRCQDLFDRAKRLFGRGNRKMNDRFQISASQNLAPWKVFTDFWRFFHQLTNIELFDSPVFQWRNIKKFPLRHGRRSSCGARKLSLITLFDLSLLFLCAVLSPAHGFTNTMSTSEMDASVMSSDGGSMRSISKHTIRCYSCMSPFYESAWMQSLSRIYAKPMNFSQRCDDTGSSLRGIALVECPSICIKIREDIELSGIPFRGYIRGCYDTMLLHGFNQTLVRWFRWLQRDSCLDYNKYHILQLPPAPARSPVAKTSTLHICTCYADTCNGSPKFSAASVTTRVIWFGRSLTFSLATTIGPLLVLICWWWRTTTDYYILDSSAVKSPKNIIARSDSVVMTEENTRTSGFQSSQ